MVSFFGLKFGDKKKKSDGKATQQKQPQQWKRVDQNAMGEGQLFGRNIDQKSVINGSIRSVSRAGTSQQQDGNRMSPYANQDTHNLAAASMFDLSGPGQRGSRTSILLKPHASDVNLRTRFGANNGSSASLAPPAPGFGARFGANNASSPSLATPGPGFGSRGSRPGTPNRAKPWVNPLDVHFARNAPSGPPTPKSPLAGSIQLPPTPTTDNAETGSVFGEEVDDMVDAVMASVKKREEAAEEAKKKEKELEKQRETARLEMERLERQKSTESSMSGRRPSAPQLLPEPQDSPTVGSSPQALARRNDSDARPVSRGGPLRAPSLHQGPPPTGPPTQCLPQLPGQGPQRQGPLGLPGPVNSGVTTGARPSAQGSHVLRAPGSNPSNWTQRPGLQASQAQSQSQKVFKPYRPPPLQGSGPLGPLPDALRSPSPPLSTPGIDEYGSRSPALKSPVLRADTASTAGAGRNTPGPERPGPEPLLSTLASPSTMTSPSGSVRKLSLDDEPVEQFARPIIQDVRAKRDTLALNTPRQQSLSMKIEELEKTLRTAQQQAQQAHDIPTPHANRTSTSSSVYSDGAKDDEPNDSESDDDGPILPIQIQPAPLRISPPIAPPGPVAAASLSRPQSPIAPPAPIAAASISRPQSPLRGPPRRGPLPRRPALEEYGVASTQVTSKSRGGTPTPASRSGSTDNYSAHSSPPSRTHTPQLRHPAGPWRRGGGGGGDLHNPQPSPAPTVDAFFDRPRPSPVVDTGFNFDFAPSSTALGGLGGGLGMGMGMAAAPPTPDSTTWPLASPTIAVDMAIPELAPPMRSQTHPQPQPQPHPPTRSETQPHPQAPPPTRSTTDPSSAGPLQPSPAAPSAAISAGGRFTRAHVPPPLNLKFNFSPDAPSRDPTLAPPPPNSTAARGLWTPPLRSVPGAGAGVDGRPSTSSGPGPAVKGHNSGGSGGGGRGSGGSGSGSEGKGGGGSGGGLAASPSLISQFPKEQPAVPRDPEEGEDDPSVFMGIGMARGPSIREVRRPKTAGGGPRAPATPLVDSFGTGFI